jgi:hypothetical protein
MHLLNKQRYRYVLFYVVIILEHDFHNQKPITNDRNKSNICTLFKFILDLMNVINIFALHLVLMEYRLIYKSIKNKIYLIVSNKSLTELVRSSILSRFNRIITFLFKNFRLQ